MSDEEHRTFYVEGNLAKAHLFLYLIGRFDMVWLKVHPAMVTPTDVPRLLMYHLTDSLGIRPLSVTTTDVTGEVPLQSGMVEVRVPWTAVWLIAGGGTDYTVDDPPDDPDNDYADEPAPKLTVIRGGKA